MSLAITFAAQTTAPVAWSTPAGTTATVQMPTNLHAAYASDSAHTQTVTLLAESPQQAPASVPSAVGIGGATLLGIILFVWIIGKWRNGWDKEAKKAAVMGAVATLLVGSWGLFGTVTQTVKSTGDSVGTSIGNTVGQAR